MTRSSLYPARCRVTLSLVVGCLAATLILPAPARAQDRQSDQRQQPDEQPGYSLDLSTPLNGPPPVADTTDTGEQKAGRVANSAVGNVGQRQERSQAVANIKPTARLNTRIANRVESRIRNRIDRFYDPEANATSPFKVAADQARENAVTRSDR